MKRIILPEMPHHVVQRGLNGRQTFFSDEDYSVYLQFMAESCRRYNVEVLAYCLMPDHVHMIAVPGEERSFAYCFRVGHGRYTQYMNKRIGRKGQFWQGRYSAHLLDENYLLACARYIEINPVKREYVEFPDEWRWSSAPAHIHGKSDELVSVTPLFYINNLRTL